MNDTLKCSVMVAATVAAAGLCLADGPTLAKRLEAPFALKTKVALVPGKRYRLSCRVKQENLRLKDGRPSAMSIGFWMYDAEGKLCRTPTCHGGFSFHGRAGETNWYELTDTSVTIPTNAAYAWFEQYSDKKATGHVWLSDAKAEPFNPPPVDYVISSAGHDTAWEGDVTFTMALDAGVSAKGRRATMLYPDASGGETRAEMAFASDGRSASVRVPVASMAMGIQSFRFVLSGADGLSEAWSGCLRFERKEASQLPAVWCGPDRKFVVRGKKFWPLATKLWGGDFKLGPDVKRMLAASGYNAFVISSGHLNDRVQGWFEENGKMAIVAVPHEDEEAAAAVRRLKGSPVTLMWYLYDEPHAFGAIEQMRAHTRLVHRLDPDHPTRACFDKIYYARMFLDCQDVICADPYPIGSGAEIGQVLDWSRQLSAGIFASKPLIMTPQSFDWSWYRGANDERAQGNHVRRMPTEDEMRCMAWQAIAGGANGLAWFSMHALLTFPKAAEKERYIGETLKVAREIADMIPVMLDEDVALPGARDLPPCIGVRAWRHDGQVRAVAVNSSRERVSCTLDLGGGKSLALDLAPIETRFLTVR